MSAASNSGPAGKRLPRRCGDDAPKRYRAVSMQLAAHLDERYVELHVRTENGESIAVACPRDSIFTLQRHIAQIGRQCPEIADWRQSDRRVAP